MYQKTDEGDPLPRYFCHLLDEENARIEQENTQRHPQEQLPYFPCLFGDLADTIPRMPKNINDLMLR